MTGMGREMNQRKRLAYIDAYKGLGMILIMFHHAGQYFTWPSDVIMPYTVQCEVVLFFVATGYLNALKKTEQIEMKKYISEKVFSLLVPWTVFSLLNSVLKLSVFAVQHKLTGEAFASELFELAVFGNGTVWFLRTLLIVDFVMIFIKKLLQNAKYEWLWRLLWMLLTIAIPFALYDRDHKAMTIIVLCSRVLIGCAYYQMGELLSRVRRLNRWLELCIGIGMVCFGIGIIRTHLTYIWVFDGRYEGGIYAVVGVSVLVIGIFEAIRALGDPRTLPGRACCYIGQHSLSIMLIHPILLMTIVYPFRDQFSENATWMFVLLWVYISAGSCLVGAFLEQHIPIIFGRKTKS